MSKSGGLQRNGRNERNRRDGCVTLAFCLCNYFPYGGLQRDFLRIALTCRRRGHEVRVYAAFWEGEVPKGFRLVLFPLAARSNPGRLRELGRRVQAHLRSHPADALIGFHKMPGLDFYYAADPCYRHKAQARPWRHRLNPRSQLYCRLEKAVFRKEAATQVLSISDHQKTLFQECYGTPERRFHPLPPGMDPSRRAPANAAALRAAFRQEFGLAGDECLLLLAGSGFKTKGLDRALRGLASLPPPLRERTRLFAVGQSDPKPFARLAAKLGVASRFAAHPGRDDLLRFFLGADLLVHPAYSEVTGTVLLEAAAAGLPALATAACGYVPCIERAQSGLILPEPFSQRRFNERLAQMLQAHKGQWQANGIAFAQAADLYAMPERAADLIERAARGG